MHNIVDDIRRNLITTLTTSNLSSRSLFALLIFIISNSSYSLNFSKRIIDLIKESED